MTTTVVIGAGQAGLAMSRCLRDRGVDHVVLERGRVAERWRTWPTTSPSSSTAGAAAPVASARP